MNDQMVVLRGIRDRVIVRPDPVPTETESGLVIPQAAQEAKATRGTVVVVGPGRYSPLTGRRLPMHVQVGDRITYSTYVGVPVVHEGEPLLIMNDADVLGVLIS